MTAQERTDARSEKPRHDLPRVATPELFTERTGLRVHPKVFDLEPIGSRVHIVEDEVPERIKSIILPDTARSMERMGSGWVIAVGPEAGRIVWSVPHPGIPLVRDPGELLYQHFYFGLGVGKIIRLSERDMEYKGTMLVMTDRDLWCLDTRPERVPWDMGE